jgi:type II secretory pathway pseudopilin PulG
MSTLAIVLIALGVVVVLFFIGGLLAVRSRARRDAGAFTEHVRAADVALEQARALDKGWHRDTMEAAARDAVAQARPGWSYDDLHLVLVDDRPGTAEDQAHFVAMAPDDQVRVILARDGDEWVVAEVAD